MSPCRRLTLEWLEDRTVLSPTLGITFNEGAGPLAELPIQSYAWSVTHSAGSSASMSEFTITLAPDSIEPGLWGRVAVGKHLDSATIHARKPSTGNEYLTFTLSDVTITSFATSDQNGSAPQDSITLQFDKVVESYKTQKSDGSLGPANIASYDRKTAKSDGIGSLAGESRSPLPGLTFVEDGAPQKGSDFAAYTWAVTNRPAATPVIHEFSLSLVPGSAEPGLWGRVATGKHLDSATIQLVRTTKDRLEVFASYTLSDVTITSFTTAGQDSGAPQDSITLQFGKVVESYKTQKSDGSFGTPNIASYDLKTAKSDGIGSLAGESQSKTPGLVFLEDGTPQKGSEFTGYTWAVVNRTAVGPEIQEFSLSLVPGSAEPGLWGRVAVGKHLDSATVQLVKLTKGLPEVYASYTLSDVTITSFTTNGQNSDAPVDNLTLQFGKVVESYKTQKSDGSLGTPNIASYDLKTAKSDGVGSLAGESFSSLPGLTFVEDGTHPQGSDFSAYTWGLSNRDGTVPVLQEFSLTLVPGSAEPGLWGRAAVGKHLDSATIQLVKTTKDLPEVFASYTLSDVTITSFSTNGQNGSAPQDSITLQFGKVVESYKTQKSDGSLGTPNIASYDRKTAKSDGVGSLAGESQSSLPGLTFVEDGAPQKGSDFIAYTWGLSNSDGTVPDIKEFSLSLVPGGAEPGLWGRVATGKHLDSATIQLVRTTKDRLEVFASYTLSDVTITSFTTAGQDSGAPQDSITLQFGKVVESYKTQKSDGSFGTPNIASYDLKTAKSDGIGSLAGESQSKTPGLVFLEDGTPQKGSEFTTYNWALSNLGTDPAISEFSLTLAPGSAEPGLWGRVAVGKHLDSATIQLVKTTKGLPEIYASYTLSDVTITSFTTNGQNSDAPFDSLTLQFGKLVESYKAQKADGSLSAPNIASYNLKTGKSDGIGSLGGPISTTALVASANSVAYGNVVTFTATVTASNGGAPTGTVTFFDGATDISGPVTVMTVNGQQVASITTANLIPGPHTITASYSDPTATFADSAGTASVTVTPATLVASGVNINAIAGAPFTGAVATFTNVDPFGSAASYTALIDWGDGSTSAGVISGTGSLTVAGTHTYADPVNATIHVTISHNLGYTTTATTSGNAVVSSLGQGVTKGLTAGIGFWHNKNGQALIANFVTTASGHSVADWLATTFPNLYGASAGANNLTGQSNAFVASYFETLFKMHSSQVEAQVLAMALNVYATTASLGGRTPVVAAAGFIVSDTGLGARSFSVGKDGAAFGVADGTVLNVYELLLAVNKKAINGVLYAGNTTLQAQATDLFNAINKSGSIG